MVQATNPKGAAKVEVVRIIPWLRVRILPVPIFWKSPGIARAVLGDFCWGSTFFVDRRVA